MELTHLSEESDEGTDMDPTLPAEAKALSPLKRKGRAVSVEEESKEEARRAANRKSAFESRKRRKILIGSSINVPVGSDCDV